MKTIVNLRWLFIGIGLASLCFCCGAYVAIQAPRLQARLLAEPDYLSLFSRTLAEDISKKEGVPVAVLSDPELAGCDMGRNRVTFTAPSGAPPGTYSLSSQNIPAGEVRYSAKQKLICNLLGQRLRPTEMVPGKMFIITPTLLVPSFAEFAVGQSDQSLVFTFNAKDVFDVKGIDLRSFSRESTGTATARLMARYPSLEVVILQKAFAAKVGVHYKEAVHGFLAIVFSACATGFFISSIGLVILYFRCASFSKNDMEIVKASYLGGSASRAVTLAGKSSFLCFLFAFDLAGYVERLFLRQAEALAATREWMELRSVMNLSVKSTILSSATVIERPLSTRRLFKLLHYEPRTREERNEEEEALRMAAIAVKAVEANKALSDFAIPQGLLPEGIPPQQLLAVTDILRTLLAGSRGLACFGQHRTSETSLRRSVYYHCPVLTATPRSYDKALAWLIGEGIVNELNESKVISYSITVNQAMMTDRGKPIRDFLIDENQRRRGRSSDAKVLRRS